MDAKQIKKEKEQQLIKLVSGFCQEKLNEEYELLCVALVKKLGRKRVVPFMKGKLEIWAAAIVNTIGILNFLFDKSFEPYIASSEIHEYFGTKSSTISTKSRTILEMQKLTYYNPEFSTQQMRENNPILQYVVVDDLFVPLDTLPEIYQEMVREARAKGEDIHFYTKIK